MSTLGAMFLSERAAEEVVAMLDESDFYKPAHQEIFVSLRNLVSARRGIDIVLVRNDLESRGKLSDAGGEEYLIQIAEYVPSPANSHFYAENVLDRATLRRLDSAGAEISGIAREAEDTSAGDRVDKAEQIVFDVARRRMVSYFEPLKSLTHEFIKDLDTIIDEKSVSPSRKSGFYDLDNMLDGFRPGELVIVAARPSMGKTALVMDIAVRISKVFEGNVAVFSLEMSSQSLVKRLVSMESSINGRNLSNANSIRQNYDELLDAVERLHLLPIYIDDTSELGPLELRAKCRRLAAENKLGVVVVDYLQLMRGSRKVENRVQELSEIGRGLKSLAKELEVPVIALSQLNRAAEARSDKRPMMSDIRESGSIEADADVVMMLYREDYYNRSKDPSEQYNEPDRVEVAEIIVAKNRNGDTGSVLLGFQPEYVRFRNLTDDAKRNYLTNLKNRQEVTRN